MANHKGNHGTTVTGPTPRGKRAVDNWLSGKFKTKKDALLEAGYSQSTASTNAHNVFQTQGIQLYLKTLSKISKHRTGLSLPDKVAMVYLDGLEATKLYGKNAIEAPDWQARKAFADKFSEFFGWSHPQFAPGSKFQQFNFFATPVEERQSFNDDFKVFLRQLQK